MPHIRVRQAQEVLSDESNYPEVVVTQARQIVQWSEAKRKNMQWLWTNRKMFQFWILARIGNTRQVQQKTANARLFTRVGRDRLNEFHKARNYLGATRNSMGMAFGLFDGLVRLTECQDVAMVLRYYECVNAARYDDTLELAAFVRWASPSSANEVLAWRLLRSIEGNAQCNKDSSADSVRPSLLP